MANANYKKFDVKHGISVNGLPFVDKNRNVTVNDLIVQGVSTVIDTRTITSVDPIISLGAAGKTYTAESITTGTPGRIKFAAAAFDDFAIGDSVEFNPGAGATSPTELTGGDIYYVVGKDTDVTSSDYRTITISAEQGGAAIAILGAGAGDLEFTLNPLRDLDQDLGIEFNYVDGTAKKGFFGYQDNTGNFTFLLDATYGSTNLDANDNPISDDGETGGQPQFTGTKSGIEVKYIKLEPTNALTTSVPGIDLDQTWNDGAITFATINVDITDTASAANSTYLDLALDGLTNFAVRKDGALTLGNEDGSTAAAFNGFLSVDGRNNADLVLVDLKDTWIDIGNDAALEEYVGINLEITNTASLGTSKLVNFYSTDNRKYELYWDGHSVQEVEFTGGGAQTAITVNLTDTSSTDESYLLDLQLADTSVFSVRKDGFVEINGPGEFHDTITIETQDPADNAYKDNTQLQTDHVNIPSGTTGSTTINSMPDDFVTAKILVQVKQGTAYHSTELMLVHNTSQVFMTEYGTVYTDNILGTFDASISNNNVNITFTFTATARAGGDAQVRTTRLAMAA